jgi:hypothetical protein
MQVPGEAEDVAHHLVGDHVAEETSHVGHDARMVDQGREHVMLQADRERLDPSKAVGLFEDLGRDLPEKSIRARDRGDGLLDGRSIDPARPWSSPLQGGKAVVFDGRMDHDFHDGS